MTANQRLIDLADELYTGLRMAQFGDSDSAWRALGSIAVTARCLYRAIGVPLPPPLDPASGLTPHTADYQQPPIPV